MRALQRQSYFWHGYARPTIGARSDIEDAPFAALQAFHKKHYRPDNAALIVSGNFDVQRVLSLSSKLFSEARNPETPKVGSWTREEARASTNRTELTLPAGRTIASSAWKLPGFTERQTYAFDLATSAICDDDWGSLRKELVLERKIAVSASCGTQLETDYGLFVATASAGKEADAEVLSRALREHIEAAAAKGITQEQLERARLNELNDYERLENSHEALAGLLSQAEVAGDWRLFFWQRDVTKTLTLEEANAALKKWAVAYNRSDVLLRHGEGIVAPDWPKNPAALVLVSGKDWPEIAKTSDPIPASASELAQATVNIALDGKRARAALISRHTQGNRAWVVLSNDYGNETTLGGRRAACSIASGLLAYGGAGLNRDQLSAKLEALQAQWTLGLGGITLESPRKNVDAALDILLAAWAAPALPISEFERIKASSIARLEAALKDPGSVAATATALRFDNYPLQHPFKPQTLEQSLAEIQAVNYADVMRCAGDFAGVAQIRLAQVGDFSVQDVQSVWGKIAKLPVAKIPYQRIKEIEAPQTVDTTPINVAMPGKPNASIVGSTLLRITDDAPDFPALRIAVQVLGGDASSRIWTRLREREGLAYGVGVSLSGNNFEPRSSLAIQASAASDKADAALASLKDELALALKEGFSAQEVERAKAAWLEQRKVSLRSEKNFAGALASGLYNGRDYAWLAQYDKKIAGLTVQEVNLALRKWLGNAPIVWMVGRGN
jgi:zinc protease